ncbi:MAG: sulfatase-like hydrolase/transferase [Bacteroidota bacterium]
MKYLISLITGSLLLISCKSTGDIQEVQEAGKPNIILIISDDAGYADFGFTGSQEMNTPHLDKLAENGWNFTQAYVTASVCCPSRMGLMTGRYQQRFGAECNVPTIPTPGFSKQDLGLDIGEKTMGDILQDQGYKTFLAGKWHLGLAPKYHPLDRGFDEFYGFLGGSRSYWPLDNPARPRKMYRNRELVDESKEIHYLTDDLTEESIDFIERNHSDPFFIYLSYNAVHTPMHAKEEDIEQQAIKGSEKRKIYAAMTQSMDENIGKLVKYLESKDLMDNTLIAFINDNGGAGNNASKNSPLRGTKGSYWEGGIRIPFFLHWPQKIKAKNIDVPISTLDLIPTFLTASGTQEIPQNLDGRDLFAQEGESAKDRPYLFWRLWQSAAVRKGDWKLIRIAEDPLHDSRALLAPLILVNLKEDPAEEKNYAESHPEIRDELLKALESWEEGLATPRWYDGKDWEHWAEMQIKNHAMN